MAHGVVARVREFVDAEVRPVALALEHADAYPHALVARMRELGLFGALVPEEYGGLGLDVTTYARIIEALSEGWMSLAGVLNSHTMAALIVLHHGTEEQRTRFLPRFARGEARGGLCLTEPHAGSDVQAIRTGARREGDRYVLNGTKTFVTNGREGNTFAVLALTDPHAEPRHRGMSCFIVEKGHPGLRVVKSISKLGYKGVDTAELVFEDVPVSTADLVGGVEGRGFKHVMSGLETGRINIAARAVGVARAALGTAVARRGADPASAEGRTLDALSARLTAARLLTSWAAGMKDRGERCDLEAGMAKLFASETAQEIAAEALRLHGTSGQLVPHAVERHYRDTPLLIIGEGTNEIQRLVIARSLLERYGERAGALTSRDGEPDERRQMVLAVRQVVEKEVVPVVHEEEHAARYPAALVARLAELGVLGALVPATHGGLGVDGRTYAMLVEELGRGWATVAAIATAHLAVAAAIARAGTPTQRERLLPPMARGELLAGGAFAADVVARRARDDWVLEGECAAVPLGARAAFFLVSCRVDGVRPAGFLVACNAPGVTVGPPLATLGARGLDAAALRLDGVRVAPASRLGGDARRGEEAAAAALGVLRLGTAAAGVGLAQAAFEAALRYSQQRSAFGKPICHHQAIQLKLADTATQTTAARLLTYHAAERFDVDPADSLVEASRRLASETASAVALEAMRIHGGYGYTTEFPVERYYRDAAWLMAAAQR